MALACEVEVAEEEVTVLAGEAHWVYLEAAGPGPFPAGPLLPSMSGLPGRISTSRLLDRLSPASPPLMDSEKPRDSPEIGNE